MCSYIDVRCNQNHTINDRLRPTKCRLNRRPIVHTRWKHIDETLFNIHSIILLTWWSRITFIYLIENMVHFSVSRKSITCAINIWTAIDHHRIIWLPHLCAGISIGWQQVEVQALNLWIFGPPIRLWTVHFVWFIRHIHTTTEQRSRTFSIPVSVWADLKISSVLK